MFLTYKHYGQVTTKAEHIFELHVLLISTVDILFWILLVELEVLGTLTEILNTTIAYIQPDDSSSVFSNWNSNVPEDTEYKHHDDKHGWKDNSGHGYLQFGSDHNISPAFNKAK